MSVLFDDEDETLDDGYLDDFDWDDDYDVDELEEKDE